MKPSVSFAAPAGTDDPTTHNNNNNTTTTNNNNNNTIDPIQTCLSIQSEFYNIGKALTCPLCLCTLRSPTLLPCNHAFCRSCLHTHFDPKHNRTISPSSGRHVYKNQCPICKIHCTKRGMQVLNSRKGGGEDEDVGGGHLELLVKAYKLCLRSFGFTPIVYDEQANIAMTQIEDSDGFAAFMGMGGRDIHDREHEHEHDRDKDGEEDKDKDDDLFHEGGPPPVAKRRNASDPPRREPDPLNDPHDIDLDLRQVHEHYEVSRGIAGILKQAVDKTALTSTNDPSANSISHQPNASAESSSSPSSSRKLSRSKSNHPRPSRPMRMTAEEMERQNQVRKLNYLLQDQEKVVQVDERALVRAAVSKQRRRNHHPKDRTSSESGFTTTTADGAGAGAAAAAGGVNDSDTSEDTTMKDNPDAVKEEQVFKRSNCDNQENDDTKDDEDEDDNDEDTVIENTQHRLDRALNAIATSDQVLANTHTQLPESPSPSQAESQTQSQVFFSAPDDQAPSSVPIMSTSTTTEAGTAAPKSVPATATVHPPVLPPIATTQDLMDDAREKEAADRSGEWLEHEVEIEEEEEQRRLSSLSSKLDKDKDKENVHHTASERDISSSLHQDPADGKIPVHAATTASARDTLQMQLSDKFFSAASQSQDLLATSTITTISHKKQFPTHFPKGHIVKVQDRTWPGVNKPGGVARIIKAHTDSNAGIKYDVAYILGGREKMVDSAFVMDHQDARGSLFVTTAAATATKIVGSSSSSTVSNRSLASSDAPSRKSRRVDERKQVEQWIAMIDAEEEESKSKGKVVGGSISSRRSSRQKSDTSSRVKVEDDKCSTMQKNVCNVGDSNKTVSRTVKRKRETASKRNKRQKVAGHEQAPKDTTTSSPPQTNQAEGDPVELPVPSSDIHEEEENGTSLDTMTFQEIIDAASTYYSTILPPKIKTKKNNSKPKQVFVTCSNLKADEKIVVQKMIQEFSNNDDAKVKLLKDFNPYKTTVLVTSISPDNTSGENIASLRTMKVMRAALAHIPIANVSWCNSCLSSKQIISPTAEHFITSLPTRVGYFMENMKPDSNDLGAKRDFSTAFYGVSSLVASRPSLLFQNTFVYICGSEWKKSTTMLKDIQLLLREGGGTVLTSAAQTIKILREELDCASSSGKKVILLCDDSSDSKYSGISAPLAKSIRHLFNGNLKSYAHAPVLAVNSKWLFDSISCAKLLECDHFQPTNPLAKAMWKLCANQNVVEQMEKV